MHFLMDRPLLVFVFSFVFLWLAGRIGASFRKRQGQMQTEIRDDLGLILGAALTLLGLIIGFTFSMAVSRYDQRKNFEEAEANAIGTEFLRADLLPAADAVKIRSLLKNYLDQRILFYDHNSGDQLSQINDATAQLETDLWNAIRAPASAQPTPISAIVVSGMNDVLNSQGYTQAAWWNRIPVAAWALLLAISLCCNLLIGYYAFHIEAKTFLFLVLPLVLAISFFLIADIDSPRGGVIRVHPQNLVSLAQSLNAH